MYFILMYVGNFSTLFLSKFNCLHTAFQRFFGSFDWQIILYCNIYYIVYCLYCLLFITLLYWLLYCNLILVSNTHEQNTSSASYGDKTSLQYFKKYSANTFAISARITSWNFSQTKFFGNNLRHVILNSKCLLRTLFSILAIRIAVKNY